MTHHVERHTLNPNSVFKNQVATEKLLAMMAKKLKDRSPGLLPKKRPSVSDCIKTVIQKKGAERYQALAALAEYASKDSGTSDTHIEPVLRYKMIASFVDVCQSDCILQKAVQKAGYDTPSKEMAWKDYVSLINSVVIWVLELTVFGLEFVFTGMPLGCVVGISLALQFLSLGETLYSQFKVNEYEVLDTIQDRFPRLTIPPTTQYLVILPDDQTPLEHVFHHRQNRDGIVGISHGLARFLEQQNRDSIEIECDAEKEISCGHLNVTAFHKAMDKGLGTVALEQKLIQEMRLLQHNVRVISPQDRLNIEIQALLESLEGYTKADIFVMWRVWHQWQTLERLANEPSVYVTEPLFLFVRMYRDMYDYMVRNQCEVLENVDTSASYLDTCHTLLSSVNFEAFEANVALSHLLLRSA